MRESIQLIGASQAASILCVNKNTIYRLWNTGKLTYWNINGTKKTTEEAIAQFLQQNQIPSKG